MNIRYLAVSGTMSALMGTTAFAGGHAACGPDGQSIRILASDFPAIHAVAGTAEENCASGAAEFTRKQWIHRCAIVRELGFVRLPACLCIRLWMQRSLFSIKLVIAKASTSPIAIS